MWQFLIVKVSHVSTTAVANHSIAHIPQIKMARVSTTAVATPSIAHITQIFFIILHCYILCSLMMHLVLSCLLVSLLLLKYINSVAQLTLVQTVT